MKLRLLLITLVGLLVAQANSSLAQSNTYTIPSKHLWGVYANAGGQAYINYYEYDASMYQIPLTIQPSLGLHYAYAINATDYIIGQLGAYMAQTTAIGTKYNNEWTNYNHQQMGLHMALGYRMDWSRNAPFFAQIDLSFRIKFSEKSEWSGSRHGNDNMVRDVYSNAYLGSAKSTATLFNAQFGYYFDKWKRHEVALFVKIPFYSNYKKGQEPLFKTQFTFADQSSNAYQLQLNGLPIIFGLQYAFWL